MSIDVILFDLGSTLIYFDGDWNEALDRADAALYQYLLTVGLPLESSFLNRFRQEMLAYFRERETEFVEYTTGYILRKVLEGLDIPLPGDEIIRAAIAQFYQVTQSYWQAESDARPTLEMLKADGYCLGLISNASDDQDVQDLVDKALLRPYLDVILTSAREGIRKPNPLIFQRALQRLGAQAQQAAMVGDMLGADILGAKNAGIYSIWITRRAANPQNQAHYDTIVPDAQIATLAELPSLLARLNQGAESPAKGN